LCQQRAANAPAFEVRIDIKKLDLSALLEYRFRRPTSSFCSDHFAVDLSNEHNLTAVV